MAFPSEDLRAPETSPFLSTGAAHGRNAVEAYYLGYQNERARYRGATATSAF